MAWRNQVLVAHRWPLLLCPMRRPLKTTSVQTKAQKPLNHLLRTPKRTGAKHPRARLFVKAFRECGICSAGVQCPGTHHGVVGFILSCWMSEMMGDFFLDFDCGV